MKRKLYSGRDSRRAVAIADLQAMARRRLPHFALEYLECGVEDELGVRANRAAFDGVQLVPRTLRDVSQRSMQTRLAGDIASAPMAIGPTGFNGMLWRDADIALARAAAQSGVPFCIATLACASIERIADATRNWPESRRWLQLYLFRDRRCTLELLQRARDTGITTAVLTTDAVVYGNRNWEARNYRGFKRPNWRSMFDAAMHGRWLANVYLPGLPRFENLDEFIGKRATALEAADWIERQMDTALTWRDVEWLREHWDGTLIVKGILDTEDANHAVRCGADAIVVTSHGGRQLDCAIPSLAALPAVADAIGGRAAILIDSGIRRGLDVIKARRLGAQGVLLGRATLYGVAAAAERGALRALEILRNEIDNGLAQLGCATLDQLTDVSVVCAPNAPAERRI
ncbi:alpha-hydroxy acid oxidase [Burkholderia sp. Ac-20353]|uniref:alpha-hydroxy acid oxidase n=1 Tax=Burkholderia sp. Ac-20353 TaxID=2703894 RepID=UPI00197C246D|nr:alpha-hydroxy acid oxidase [Burkholderia sp. Ac-20353]MBN3786641.1 alpha-hydroxy-acid oxidizing protein [Burkholderia sp. Ac-20353]